MFLPNSTINPGVPATWTLLRDVLPDRTTLVTYYHPVAFRGGCHFDTLVYEQGCAIGGSHVSATEAEARTTHAELLATHRARLVAA